jgi:hypothetical protein
VFILKLRQRNGIHAAMVLPIYRRHLLGLVRELLLGDDFIPYVLKAQNLGVTFNNDLSSGL